MNRDEKIEELQEMFEMDPRKALFGCLIGGGWNGEFLHWFLSFEKFKYAMLELFPAVHELEGDELLTYQVGLKEILDKNKSDEITEKLQIDMNQYLESTSVGWEVRITWYGTFDELTHGDTDFAKQIRRFYYDTDSVIGDNEIEKFVDDIHTYGI